MYYTPPPKPLNFGFKMFGCALQNPVQCTPLDIKIERKRDSVPEYKNGSLGDVIQDKPNKIKPRPKQG